MKKVILFMIILAASCNQQEPEKEAFSLYSKKDVNDIVMAVLTHDSLPVNKNAKINTGRVGHKRIIEPFILSVDSELIKLHVYNNDSTQRGKHFIHFAGISELIRYQSSKYFEISDSTYLMFQNDHMAASTLKSSELTNLILCHHQPGKRTPCIGFAMPLFSKGNDIAYLEMWIPESGHNGYFLRKINNQWVVVQRIGYSIA